VTELAVVYRSVDELIPYARNARTHSDAQIAQIAGSIREFGFTNPVLLDGEKGILAGHGRVLGARKLGMGAVPCIELAHLSPAQRRAYILADNKLALNAGWDEQLLRLEVADLAGMAFDLSLIGFGQSEQAALLAAQGGLTDPDDTPEPPADPTTRPGDLWLLGAKVTCPNCRKSTPLERAIRR
jgi:ParB-like chromosome segregation protein Spo0J